MVHSMIFGRLRKGKNGTLQVPLPSHINETDIAHVQALLRACVGYYHRTDRIATKRIPARVFFDMCGYLRVSPLQLFSSTVVEIWDPATRALYKIGLSSVRRMWKHG